MKKSKQKTIKIREDEVSVIEIEVNKPMIDFYKKETGRSHVTEKGLSNFIQNLVQIHNQH